ncbi:carboxypeptidase-like regulatory domain-containing protein [Spirosoma sp. RP8]|uniref:Carboxypeptidase-like regulatory domain-containing protein n=1 Tax=Spirosoma liriopis TaxID=2937440 RepID=A0ABT0HT39_9BACT|nr:carboxypeptidase-like regulatory domain-containing protein [Spirosoma liriopis]MCK8495345.1 carboxypeptidase-like regulatory domain-containing protein [Spirosoma liriopis]
MKAFSARMGLLLWLSLKLAFAQTPTASLTGRILDAKSGEPLPFATIYLNNSSQGTNADQNGVYKLTAVPLGNQELVSSVLGYKTARLPIRLTDTRQRTLDLKLEPADQSLAGVTVKARHDKNWLRQVNVFRRELLGYRPQARQCRITNANVLSFQEEKGHLQAQANEPLLIENEALGYRIYYNLLYFDLYRGKMQFAGTSRFEEMTAADARQKTRWQTNRIAVYQGSIQHLLASLLAGTHEQAGYRVYRSPLTDEGTDRIMPFVRTQQRQHIDPQKAVALFKSGGLSFERQLISDQPLEVYYDRVYAANSPYHDSPYAYSMLLLPNGRLEMNTNGWVTSSNGLDVRGYMGNDRLATLLPADWNPPTSEMLLANSVGSGRIGGADANLDSLTRFRKRDYERTAPLVYLHTDKSFYVVGDQLWFSAYVVDAARQLPVVGSGATTLQVELIAPTGQSVQHQWLAVTDGRASGNFRLVDSLSAGKYQLRAITALDPSIDNPAFACTFPIYTAQSDNLLPLSGFTRPTYSPHTARQAPVEDSLDVQFLPEGGRWLANDASRLGIKAVAPDGRGRAIGGRIVDQSDREVARFRTNGLGMGQVSLTPQTGQQYRAIIESGASQQLVTLPAFESEGWSLSVDAVTDSSRLTVRMRGTGRYSQQPVYLTLQSREKLVYRQKWLLQKGEAQFALSTAGLPPGICRLTLWDTTRHARAERLVYVPDRSGGVQMRVTLNKVRYNPREQVALGFQLRNADSNPVVGSWSASITDADQLSLDTNRADLPTYMLLTAGLTGWVESPGYYLEPKHVADLDNLLLTQGWRRLPASQPADSTGGWTLSGRVRERQGKGVSGQSVVVLLEQGGQKMLHSLMTNPQGVFRLDKLFLSDTVGVRAGVVGSNGYRLSIDKPGSTGLRSDFSPTPWQPPSNQLADARRRQLAWPAFYRDSTARQLAEVLVRAMKPMLPERPKDVERSSLHGTADNVMIVEPGSVFASMADLLKQMPGVTLLLARNNSSFGDNEPLFLIDGVYVYDQSVIQGLSPSEVSRVEVLRNPTTAGIYGARGANGVIAIYTRKEGSSVKDLPTSISTTMFGYSSPREFYVPRYEQPAIGSPIDQRDVLYWQAIGQTDADGLGRLVFPLSDTAKRLRFVLQGLTNEGVPMSFTWELPVR